MGCSWLNGRKGERWKTGRKCRKELQAPHGARFGSTARSSSAQIPLTHQLPLIGIPAHPSEEEAGSPCDLSVAARWVSHTGPEAEQCAPTQKIFAWARKCLRLNFENVPQARKCFFLDLEILDFWSSIMCLGTRDIFEIVGGVWEPRIILWF